MSDLVPRSAAPQFTLADIEVGARLYEALAQHAAAAGGAPIAYDALLTLARSLHPKDATLGRAVPLGIGAKLSLVEAFCRTRAYPNLACLAVQPGSMRPRAGYVGDWEAERAAVAGADWQAAAPSFAAYMEERRAAVPRRLKPRKERPADVAWYAYFCAHRAACAQVGTEEKKEIINLMMAGIDPESALRQVLTAKTEFGNVA
jgi:hypothetical protein